MKIKNILFVLIIAIISLTSCQITEKIYLNEDGSGTFDLEVDMSQMMKSLGSMGKEKEIDSTYVANDTIMDFSKMLLEKKDSIAKLPKEKREELEKLKGMLVKIHEDKNKNEFTMSYVMKFKNVKELIEMQNMMGNAQSLDEGKDKKLPSKTNMKFSFKKNKFKRESIAKKLTETEVESYDKSMEQFNMFMDGSSYTIEYHFPKPIKSTTAKNATFSADKKVLYLKSTLKEVTDTPAILDFEVKLQK